MVIHFYLVKNSYFSPLLSSVKWWYVLVDNLFICSGFFYYYLRYSKKKKRKRKKQKLEIVLLLYFNGMDQKSLLQNCEVKENDTWFLKYFTGKNLVPFL